MAKYEHLKQVLYEFYKNNGHLSRKEVFDKFRGLGAPERTLNRWLVLLAQNKTLGRKKGSGRVTKKATPKVIKVIKRYLNNKTGQSQRKVSTSFNTSQSYVSRILKKHSHKKYKQKQPQKFALQKKQLMPKLR